MDEDDDWLETPAQGSSHDPLVDQEYTRLEQRYTDAGYREGITEGKLSTLQEGFDEGFSTSVEASRRLGQLRGRTTAILHFVVARGLGDGGLEGELRQLLRDLGGVRRQDVLKRDLEREEHEKEHDDFDLVPNDQRDMERLESALGGISTPGGTAAAPAEGAENGKREGELLDSFEKRVRDLQARIRNP